MADPGGASVASTWEPGDPVYSVPDPEVCTSCHEHRPFEMALHSGRTHICQDCADEGR